MDASGHCCSDICAQKDSKFFGLNLICSECNSPAYINCILARPSPSFREFCLTFMIIDDEDKSLIASNQKMTEMKNTLSSMFCTRNSNFAFKCVNCKNFDLFKHENSIQLNNTFVANVDSVGKDTTNSNIASKNAVSGTDSNAVESEKSSEGNSINTASSNVHPSDLNAESKNLHYDKLIKRNMNIHQDATNQGGSNLTMPSCSLPTDSSAISTPKTDDTFSIHLTKFDVDKKWTDIAEYITVMTSLKLDTHFTVLKLLPKGKGSRRSLSFVSFKINSVSKDVFDKIMLPDL